MHRYPNEILIPYNKLLHKVIDDDEKYIAAEGEIFLRRYKPEKEKKTLYDVCVGTSYGEHMRIATFHEDEPTFFVICEREKLPNPGNSNQIYIVDEDLAYWNGTDYTYIHTSINGRLTDIENAQQEMGQQISEKISQLENAQQEMGQQISEKLPQLKEIYVGIEEPTDPNIKIWLDLTQNKGSSRLASPMSNGGTQSKDSGEYIPQKNVDSLTDEDIQLIADAVYTKILEKQEG